MILGYEAYRSSCAQSEGEYFYEAIAQAHSTACGKVGWAHFPGNHSARCCRTLLSSVRFMNLSTLVRTLELKGEAAARAFAKHGARHIPPRATCTIDVSLTVHSIRCAAKYQKVSHHESSHILPIRRLGAVFHTCTLPLRT